MDPQLVDRIYESSFVPELWPDVLDELGRISQCNGGTLLITKDNVRHWTASVELRERVGRWVNEGWIARGQSLARFFAMRHSGFVTDLDVFSPEELEREPLYRDFWRPQGVGWAVGTAIQIPTGENISFVLTRRIEHQPVERAIVQMLDELRPHLARSALLSARLQLDRARVASETLAALGIPALVLSEQGKVLAANSLIEALSGYVQWRAQDRVSLKDRAADKLLRDAIAAIYSPTSAVRSFPVRDDSPNAMMVAHIVPIRLSARDIFVRCAAVVVLTPVTRPQAPPVELVQSLFDLSPTEASIARSLAAGETVEAIAASRRISQNTIRFHVRGVLEKTGCHRQADMIALLTAISPARLTPSA